MNQTLLKRDTLTTRHSNYVTREQSFVSCNLEFMAVPLDLADFCLTRYETTVALLALR